MNKSPSRQTATIKHHKTIKVILITSLLINLLLLIGLVAAIYITRSDSLETARYNYFLNYYCSDEWNDRLSALAEQSSSQSKDYAASIVAGNNYNCQTDDAESYYQQGLDAYLKSRGLDLR